MTGPREVTLTSMIMRQTENGTLFVRQPNSRADQNQFTCQGTTERARCSSVASQLPLISPQQSTEWVPHMGLEILDQHSLQTQVPQAIFQVEPKG
jgi:hypothetical protein